MKLTSERCSGIKTGYWSFAKKDELVQKLGTIEDKAPRRSWSRWIACIARCR